jgi:hypothetical protein
MHEVGGLGWQGARLSSFALEFGIYISCVLFCGVTELA